MVLWSRRGEDLLRPGRRRRESERVGGGGGRLDLRREMLRVEELEECEYAEEALLCFLRLRPADGEPLRFSEHTEGVERPEDSSGSQAQPSPAVHPMSWLTAVQSLPVWLLWRLQLGERDL